MLNKKSMERRVQIESDPSKVDGKNFYVACCNFLNDEKQFLPETIIRKDKSKLFTNQPNIKEPIEARIKQLEPWLKRARELTVTKSDKQIGGVIRELNSRILDLEEQLKKVKSGAKIEKK